MNKLNRLIMNESVESRPQSLMGWEGLGVGLTRLYPLPQSLTLKYYNLKLKKKKTKIRNKREQKTDNKT